MREKKRKQNQWFELAHFLSIPFDYFHFILEGGVGIMMMVLTSKSVHESIETLDEQIEMIFIGFHYTAFRSLMGWRTVFSLHLSFSISDKYTILFLNFRFLSLHLLLLPSLLLRSQINIDHIYMVLLLLLLRDEASKRLFGWVCLPNFPMFI